MLYVSGIISDEVYQVMEKRDGPGELRDRSFVVGRLHYFHYKFNRSAWDDCTSDADVVLSGTLGGISRVANETFRALSGRPLVRLIWMHPHPWSGDILTHKRRVPHSHACHPCSLTRPTQGQRVSA